MTGDKTMLRFYPRGAVLFYVAFVYAFYPTCHLSIMSMPHSLYQYLAEGFLSGQLSLSVLPSPELLHLTDPYSPMQNIQLRLHDASLYHGKYYLYFGPLPVLFFYLPFKVLTGFYPSDALAVFFFMTMGFFVGFWLLIQLKERYFSHLPEWQLILAGLLLGFSNGTPFLLSRPVVYEVAIASAFCLMMMALFFLYAMCHHGCKKRDVFLSGFCLSWSVAGRPHFVLVCVFLIPVVCFYLWKHAKQRVGMMVIFLISPVMIGLLLGWYNELRFGSIWNFGHVFQLSCNDIRALHVELSNVAKIPRNIGYGLYYYVFQPFTVRPYFPYVGLRLHPCWYHVDQDYYVEAIAGVFTTMPFFMILLALPIGIKKVLKKHTHDVPLVWFVVFLLIIPAVTALFLLTMPFAIQRYEVDFVPYLVLLSIITLWLFERYFSHVLVIRVMTIIFYGLGIFSIYLGLSFALAYWVFR